MSEENTYPNSPANVDFGRTYTPLVLDGKTKNRTAETVLEPMRKGDTFNREFLIENLDITDHEFRMAVKEGYDSTAPELFFSSEEIDETKERIIVDIENSVITLYCPHSITQSIDLGTSENFPKYKEYVYDLEIINPDGEVYTLIEGKFIIVEEITTEEYPLT